MRPRLALLAVMLLAPFAALGPAHAQPPGAQPLDRLLPEIRRSHPGQFLDVEPGASESGSPRYRLRWLTPEGRVIWLDADARTGRVIGQAPDRESFGRQRPEPPPRGNFRAPAFDDDDGPRGSFGSRFAPRPDFSDEDRAGPRELGRERFNRPSFGGGNREGFGNRRFGGDGPRGFGNRGFGGRGRGPSE